MSSLLLNNLQIIIEINKVKGSKSVFLLCSQRTTYLQSLEQSLHTQQISYCPPTISQIFSNNPEKNLTKPQLFQ